jgi:hypothetical protein
MAFIEVGLWMLLTSPPGKNGPQFPIAKTIKITKLELSPIKKMTEPGYLFLVDTGNFTNN